MNWHAIRAIYGFEMARTRRTLMQSIASLKAAIIALSKHQPTGLTQQAVLAMAQLLRVNS